MQILIILILSTCFLAYSNGANDNFKGVATLFGSKTTDYKKAIWWATITTFVGSMCSVIFAQKLLKHFSGKGLVPDVIAASPEFLIAVALGAACTVILATLIGFPISTTHALTGALTGAGFMAVGKELHFAVLGQKFFMPLLLSPLVAIVLSGVLYIIFKFTRRQLGITKEYCVCVGETEKVIPVVEPAGTFSLSALRTPEITVAKEKDCQQRYIGRVLGFNCQVLLDFAHYISAGLVSFARGLNDTPKIVALLIAMKAMHVSMGMFVVGVAMAIGGLLNARKVADTMSNRITTMNHGQGFTANLVTGFLVIVASRLGMPVSTTHASCGSLFGIGLVTGRGDVKTINKIIFSWILTLPIAAFLSSAVYFLLR